MPTHEGRMAVRTWWKKIQELVQTVFRAGGRSYTLLIVPSAQTRVRRIVVPGRFLKRGAVIAGIGALVLGLLLIDYTRNLIRVTELKRLRAETAAQRVKAAQVALGLVEMENEMSRLRKLERRLRTAFDLDRGLLGQESGTGPGGGEASRESSSESGIDEAGRDPKMGVGGGETGQDSKMGVGGGETSRGSETGTGGGETSQDPNMGIGGGEISLADLAGSTDVRLSDLAAQVDLDLERMKGRFEAQERGFSELVDFLEDRKLLLASTPSIMPVNGRVSSGFRRRNDPFTGNKVWHLGLDISTDMGTPVLAPADGFVTAIGRNDVLGNLIALDHGYGYLTRFGHNSKIIVRAGQKVRRGQVIALVGSTGRSTGPHLHYEVYHNGVPVDPEDFIIN